MNLKTYFQKNPDVTINDFAKRAGVSHVTVRNVLNGLSLASYPKAKGISEATKGLVTIADLCDGNVTSARKR